MYILFIHNMHACIQTCMVYINTYIHKSTCVNATVCMYLCVYENEMIYMR